MTNNFIKLTQINKNKVYLNASLIESIEETDDKTLVNMTLNSKSTYQVIETPEQIIKKIEETGYFKTILK